MGIYEHDNAHVKKFNDTICAGDYSEISESLKVWRMIPK